GRGRDRHPGPDRGPPRRHQRRGGPGHPGRAPVRQTPVAAHHVVRRPPGRGPGRLDHPVTTPSHRTGDTNRCLPASTVTGSPVVAPTIRTGDTHRCLPASTVTGSEGRP